MTGKCYNKSSVFTWANENTPYGGNLDVYEIDSIPNNSPVAQKGAHHVYVPEDVYTILATDTHKHHPISFAIGADGVPLAVLPPVYND